LPAVLIIPIKKQIRRVGRHGHCRHRGHPVVIMIIAPRYTDRSASLSEACAQNGAPLLSSKRGGVDAEHQQRKLWASATAKETGLSLLASARTL
jgi:hypothetical protein